jgi:uncharacterized protein YqjF (DUF2071 family)
MTADEILAASSHRSFPLPKSPWVMRQEWHDLLFAHWPVPTEVLHQKVPQQLELDLWKGDAYLGVIPFVIRNLRPRNVPSIPVISHFAEINVRTYVTYRGIPGVYFFSLDAANMSAVLGARFMYALPYFHARFNLSEHGADVYYESRRLQRPRPAQFKGSYRPISEVHDWQPPSELLERFVSERYCLYSVSKRHVYRANIHHLPWPLQSASAEIETNSMAEPIRIPLMGQPPLLHFSKFMDVLTWLPEQAD